jgi:hypothetical protein
MASNEKQTARHARDDVGYALLETPGIFRFALVAFDGANVALNHRCELGRS